MPTRSAYPQTPARLDLSATSGDDWGMRLALTSSGTAMNLTGYTWVAAIYPLGLTTTTQAIAVAATDPTNGIIDLSLTDTETDALNGPYSWSITWTNGTETFTPIAGTFKIYERGQGV